VSETRQFGATGELDFRAGQGADSKQLAILRIDIGELVLPAAATPALGVALDDDPNAACKYVINGIPLIAADYQGNPLPRSAPPDG
jgi:hypothetical protein